MIDTAQIKEHADIVGANEVHIGTVDHVEGDRIKLTRKESTDGRHHFIPIGLVADIEGGVVRLSANEEAAVLLEEGENDRSS